jgi:Sulfocyanin (SoxE) domain
MRIFRVRLPDGEQSTPLPEHERKTIMMWYRGRDALAAGCMLVAVCQAQAQSPASSPPRADAADTTTWLQADSATKTVALSLEVSRPADAASALLNGFRSGEIEIVVPFGWTVTWNFQNQDSTAPHSLVLMTARERVPLEGGRSAFSNARTRMVTEGLPAGQTDRSSFEVDEAGWYWLICGVPGHAIAGEWIELQVSREAKTAAVKRTSR